ncbi:hypothetical protein BsWGS_00981 [Bradybaena similaris]
MQHRNSTAKSAHKMPMAAEEEEEYLSSGRAAVSYLERFERYDSQELLYQISTHWLLGPDLGRLDTESIQLKPSEMFGKDNLVAILFPVKNEVAPICFREVHNIVRELTLGMYVLNQTPYITLDANYDRATVCSLPPAYMDTYIGQLLTNVDYMIKALWHGAYIPKEKRIKFCSRWRMALDVNMQGKSETRKSLVAEFMSSGLMDITKDPDYAKVYDNLPVDIPNDEEMEVEKAFFMSHVENLSMQLTLVQDHMETMRNLYLVNSSYNISSIIRLMDTQIDHVGYERLKTRMQIHQNVIEKHLADKKEICRQLELLKLVSCLIPLFVNMRRRGKTPDIHRLLPPYSSDECRTEREFPPIIMGQDFKCTNFSYTGQYFHLHGGINFDLEADSASETSPELISEYLRVMELAQQELRNHFNSGDRSVKEHYNIPVCTIGGKVYYAIALEFEALQGIPPYKPVWVKAYNDEIDKLKPKRLPVADVHVLEQFKKFYGFKKAMKYKTPAVGIKVCTQRNCVGMMIALARKISGNKIYKQDEQGLSLLHHAAIHNRTHVIIRMLTLALDVNIRRNNILSAEYKKAFQLFSSKATSSEFVLPKVTTSSSLKQTAAAATGPTPMHMAARCGSLDAVSCLWFKSADLFLFDQDGWAPIHYAAFYDHQSIVRFMVRKSVDLLELQTKNKLMSTALLLAASAGALSVVKCLIKLSADVDARDTDNNNVVTLAALRFHTNVLQYLIEKDLPSVNVWQILVEMLLDDRIENQDSAVKCLEVLSTSEPMYWANIRDAGGIQALVKLLHLEDQDIQSMAVSILCNMTEQPSVRRILTKTGVIPVLIKLLGSTPDIQSRVAIILADIAQIDDNQSKITECNGIPPLVELLHVELEDILINVVNAIRVLCLDHVVNQRAVAECGGLDPLVELLSVASEDLQAGAAAALASATLKNTENQNYVISMNAHKPLVELIRNSKSTIVQVKAAKALEALAANNLKSQKFFLGLDAPKALIRLLKNVNVQVREQGACSLWSLAGNTRIQQKYIAERISIAHISQMLLEPTEKLLYVGCMTAVALTVEDMASQNKLAASDAIPQLVSLLRSSKTSQKVLYMVIKVIGILCVGVAFRNNQLTQEKITEEGAIPLLVNLFHNAVTDEMKIEVAVTLACLTLNFKQNQQLLAADSRFSIESLSRLLKFKNLDLRLKAGMAITTFCFNNVTQQQTLKDAKIIKYSKFQKFLESQDEFYQCYAAFQIVVLAGVILDKDQIALTAQGIEMLVSKIMSADEKIVVLACNLLAALSHTRAGLSDAMVSVGVLDMLVTILGSDNIMVRSTAAVALGYLTFNKTAYRLLFSRCRNMPGLFERVLNNIGEHPHINEDFITDFKKAVAVGMPCHFLLQSQLPHTSQHQATDHHKTLKHTMRDSS